MSYKVLLLSMFASISLSSAMLTEQFMKQTKVMERYDVDEHEALRLMRAALPAQILAEYIKKISNDNDLIMDAYVRVANNTAYNLIFDQQSSHCKYIQRKSKCSFINTVVRYYVYGIPLVNANHVKSYDYMLGMYLKKNQKQRNSGTVCKKRVVSRGCKRATLAPISEEYNADDVMPLLVYQYSLPQFMEFCKAASDI